MASTASAAVFAGVALLTSAGIWARRSAGSCKSKKETAAAVPALRKMDARIYVGYMAKKLQVDVTDPSLAAELDKMDTLAEYRDEYIFPPTEATAKVRAGTEHCLYFCGNSLGLQPKNVRKYIGEELDKWSEYGVEAHFKPIRPWVSFDEVVESSIARVVGATPEEVTTMNTLTTNLHLLMVSFYRPTTARYKIIVERKAFPSDAYMVQSQVRFHGFDPATAIIEVGPREGEETLRTEDILAAIEEHGDETALVFFGAVQYYTGQFFDIEAITKKAHDKGCVMGIDCAHAAGNVRLQLHDWGVDFAGWCTYKYLNSGPGSIAGIFVHERHRAAKNLPRFEGWWGHRKEDRFQMDHEFKAAMGASAWALSNPPIFQIAALRASLELFDRATMPALRRKSELLTAYLERLIREELADSVTIVTPSNPKDRGCQLSLTWRQNVKDVYKKLADESVILDVREPHAMRVAPTPMYNSFADVRELVTVLVAVAKELDDAAPAAAAAAAS